VQWKAELRGGAAASPVLDSVRLAYLPQNMPPLVKSISVNSLVSPNQAKPAGTTTPSTVSYSITVTDSGEAGASSLSGTATQPVTRAANEQLLVSWQTEDPDGDRLQYTVYFRGEQEREWKLLKNRITDNNITLDSESLADGRYLFRVVASDALINAPAQAREAELASAPVLVDRTPPIVQISARAIDGGGSELTATALDAASPLVRAEYSVNAGPWNPVAPEDGIVDSPGERFLLRVDPGSGRERVIVVRVYDSGNNAGLGRIVLQ
jgi:hypothetical protein